MAAAQFLRLETGARAAVRISIEGYTPDGIPVIGPGETTPGLIHAIGFSEHDFQLGPAVGELLAEMAVDGRPSISVDAFAIQRFNGVGEAA
jgi:sarcosine oxidase subunit beta